MKIILLVIVGILFWTSDDARNFTADQLNNASEIVRINFKSNSDHETILSRHTSSDFDGADLSEEVMDYIT